MRERGVIYAALLCTTMVWGGSFVAINQDENAQIFKFARFGIVGDYRQVIPPLIERLKELLST